MAGEVGWQGRGGRGRGVGAVGEEGAVSPSWLSARASRARPRRRPSDMGEAECCLVDAVGWGDVGGRWEAGAPSAPEMGPWGLYMVPSRSMSTAEIVSSSGSTSASTSASMSCGMSWGRVLGLEQAAGPRRICLKEEARSCEAPMRAAGTEPPRCCCSPTQATREPAVTRDGEGPLEMGPSSFAPESISSSRSFSRSRSATTCSHRRVASSGLKPCRSWISWTCSSVARSIATLAVMAWHAALSCWSAAKRSILLSSDMAGSPPEYALSRQPSFGKRSPGEPKLFLDAVGIPL